MVWKHTILLFLPWGVSEYRSQRNGEQRKRRRRNLPPCYYLWMKEVCEIHNHFCSVFNKTIDKSKKICYNFCVEEGIDSFKVVE